MRILKYAIKNIKRNAFLSLSSVLVLSLIIFFINILLLVNYTTDIIIQNINQRLTLSVTLNKWYTNENSEVIDLISWIRSLNSSVLVTYVSPEEAFSTMKERDPELTKLVENPNENPLPASIKIENIWIREYNNLDAVIWKYKSAIVYDEKRFKKKIIDYRAQYDRINSVIKVFNSIKLWIYWIIGFFFFSVFIIIYNIIWNFIFFYRDEIKITKLVGGDNIFIYWPFSVQGFLYTLFSSLLSFVIFLYIIKTVNIYLIDDFPWFVNRFLESNSAYFFYEIAWISLIWLLSWFLSSQKFINKTAAR
ncbi:MAG: hypothetical protein ACD_3C00131G0002 [uncultured bacterium (gcode 4)]|uniref:Cell division protein FtsX n=1 Tax=uncultured bacterium (gcode 4) TaxID=1234023 RepID=K2F9U3_9BACT|nr:MAG: hypothetical protein ACD_3C00131G0002 [uncultured bacterium (gcode 4)]